MDENELCGNRVGMGKMSVRTGGDGYEIQYPCETLPETHLHRLFLIYRPSKEGRLSQPAYLAVNLRHGRPSQH